MSLSVIEIARIMEQMEESPEKVMFSRLLNELGQQSGERIRSAAKRIPVSILRELTFQFQQVLESRKEEQVEVLAKQLSEQGISADELKAYLAKRHA
ncbi:hypothetical protein HGP28_18190 [Vibrio sp. SM6]|uniref:DNA-binding protein H-NS-like N-terminal domain-containing protein n=1 Tax=Vibrio agarilyticus TaxID=2726741 RepID=A0A7X8TUD2_9VIBR|nr:hypothetical protein [Vibrio agarilyticus]NLS14791.1 hypothetical protein [Vibrio agarilyticus]